jgi:hypothetical protein
MGIERVAEILLHLVGKLLGERAIPISSAFGYSPILRMAE